MVAMEVVVVEELSCLKVSALPFSFKVRPASWKTKMLLVLECLAAVDWPMGDIGAWGRGV